MLDSEAIARYTIAAGMTASLSENTGGFDELADNVARCVDNGGCANVHISPLHLYTQNEQGDRIAGADSR